jgi:hypothetical protein
MVLSSQEGVNFLQSLPKPTNNVVNRDGSIIDVNHLFADIRSGHIAAQAGMGLLDVTIMTMASWGLERGASALTGRLMGMAARKSLVSAATKARNAALKRLDDAVSTAQTSVAQAELTVANRALNESTKALKRASSIEQYNAMGGGLVGGIASGLLSSLWLDEAITKASNSAIESGQVDNLIHTGIIGSGRNLKVINNTNWWSIDQGPIYELAEGITPKINFCENVVISQEYCSHKYVIRDMVNRYHGLYQTNLASDNDMHEYNHIKKITAIEPRGIDGCYYKMSVVSYDPKTNIEGDIEQDARSEEHTSELQSPEV